MKHHPQPLTLTAKDIMKLDGIAASQFRIPTLLLMENAGRSVALEAKLLLTRNGSVLVVSGNGNNGGDGFVAARHLANFGIKVKVWIIGKPERFKPDTVTNYQIITAMNVPISFLEGPDDLADLRKDLKTCALIIDALFGIGLNRNLEEPFLSLIQIINQAKKLVLSIDLPSGLHADTGSVMGKCVKAHITVTLSVPKSGLYVNEGPAHAGKIKVVDISIPKLLINSLTLSLSPGERERVREKEDFNGKI